MLDSGRGSLAVVTLGSSCSCQTWTRLPSSERLARSAVAGWVVGSLAVNAGPLAPLLVPPPLCLGRSSVCGRSGGVSSGGRCLGWSSGAPRAFYQTLTRLPSQERLARRAVAGVGALVLLVGLLRWFCGPRWYRYSVPSL